MGKTKTNKEPAGMEILRYFYCLTALLSSLHLFFFLEHTDVLWFEAALPKQNSFWVALILIFVPLLLYFGFKFHSLFIWFMAFIYHIFFTLNSLLGTVFALWNGFPFKPMIRITGKNLGGLPLGSDTALKLFTVFNLNLFMGTIILWYLWRKRRYFKMQQN